MQQPSSVTKPGDNRKTISAQLNEGPEAPDNVFIRIAKPYCNDTANSIYLKAPIGFGQTVIYTLSYWSGTPHAWQVALPSSSLEMGLARGDMRLGPASANW